MRATTFLLSAALTQAAVPAFAQSSYNVVVEPVTPTIDTIITAPIEYDENGVMKAQHFKADDLTEAQYQALLAEADRIRAYRAANNMNFEQDYVSQGGVTTQIVTTEVESAPMMEIELFEPAPAAPIAIAETSSFKMHTVAKGDTLYNISKRYDTTVAAIQAENQMSGTALSLGQKIRIPGVVVETINTVAQPLYANAPIEAGYVTRLIVEPVTKTPQIESVGSSAEAIYAVLPKDTLYSISRRTCVGVKEIISRNAIENPNALKPGQRITLPAGHCLAR